MELPELVVRALIETIILLGFLGLTLKSARMTFGRQVGKPFRATESFLLVSFFVLWGFAQGLDRFQYEYPNGYTSAPISRFAMYQYQDDEKVRVSWQWRVGNRGEVSNLNLAALFPAISVPGISSRMTYLAGFRDGAGKADPDITRELNSWATGIFRELRSRGHNVQTLMFLEVSLPDGEARKLMEWEWGKIEFEH